MKCHAFSGAVFAIAAIGALAMLPGVAHADTTYTNRWAILVGITDYQYLDDLYYPGNDVDDMTRVLMDMCGFPRDHIFTYKDGLATRNGIKNALSQLARKAGSADLVVFYFSGHGEYQAVPDSPPLDEADGYDEVICPYDSLSNSYENDITDDEIQSWLSAIPSRNTVAIFDSCGSGGMTRSAIRGVAGRPQPGGKTDGFARDFSRDISGRKFVVLMASDDNEDSWDINRLQNGLFSYYLLEGLGAPSADTDGDSWISAEEAFAYASPRTTVYKSAQHPQLFDGDVNTEAGMTCLGSTVTPTPTPTAIGGQDITGRVVQGSLGAGGSATYTFDLPPGVSTCTVALDGPAGADFDLYVRRGSPPAEDAYDYRGYTSSADETVTMANPAAGRYYVMVTAYSGSGAYAIGESHQAGNTVTPTPTPTATIRPTGRPTYPVSTTVVTTIPTSTPTATIRPTGRPTFPISTTIATPTPTATGGQDITGRVVQGSLGAGGSATYTFDLPPGVSTCTVALDGPAGADFDLYVRRGSPPAEDAYDYRGYTSSADETVTMANPAAGRYYVMVTAYSGSGAYAIGESHQAGNTVTPTPTPTATIRPTGRPTFPVFTTVATTIAPTPTPTVSPVTTLGAMGYGITNGQLKRYLGPGMSSRFYFDIPAGVRACTVTLDGPAGADFDLYIRKGTLPTTSTYDYRGFTSSADENITIPGPGPGRYYVLVQSFSGSGWYTIAERH